MESVKTRKSKWPSPIWLVPVLSILVAGWLIWQQLLAGQQDIVITFKTGDGLKPGVPVKFRGVPVGSVDSISLSDDLKHVEVHASLNKGAEKLARKDSRFWIVKPEIGVTQARNLDTLVSGKYIAVKAGGGDKATHFKGLDAPPEQQPESGLRITLEARSLGSLKEGRKVYYRDVAVGTVGKSHLSRNARHVDIQVVIKPAYARLVRKNSKFWNSSGLDVDFGLFSGADIRASSLENLLRGGVSFATPDKAGPLAPPGTHFTLHKKAKDDWSQWSPALKWR